MKSVLNIYWKDWCLSWNSNTLAMWCEELTHWKKSWCWQRLKAGREVGDREWDVLDGITDWMDMSLSRLQELVMDRKPGVLWSMGSQRAGHDWVDWSVSINKLSKGVSSLLNLLIGHHQKCHLLSHLSICIWALPLTLSSSLSRHSSLCSAFLDIVSCIFLSSTSFWFPWLDYKDIHSRDFVF